MSKAKHTPGPWIVSGVRSTSPQYKGHGVGPDGEDYVVTVPYSDLHHGECLANSRLISAAPELLSSAKALLALIEHPSVEHDETCPQIIAIKAAIAKAEAQS